MKIKTSELTGAALDWAVAKCVGKNPGYEYTLGETVVILGLDPYNPSTNWSQAGPIIEWEKITIDYRETFGWWVAYVNGGTDDEYGCTGPTPLIAAMRCFVTSRLGDEVELPAGLK